MRVPKAMTGKKNPSQTGKSSGQFPIDIEQIKTSFGPVKFKVEIYCNH